MLATISVDCKHFFDSEESWGNWAKSLSDGTDVFIQEFAPKDKNLNQLEHWIFRKGIFYDRQVTF